jgi:hypothetical protein
MKKEQAAVFNTLKKKIKIKRRSFYIYDETELSSSSSSLRLNCKLEIILFECLKVIGVGDDSGGGIDFINARFCC